VTTRDKMVCSKHGTNRKRLERNSKQGINNSLGDTMSKQHQRIV